MTRMRVRALCLAFVLAVCATGATAEETEVSDVVGAPVMLPKTATSAPAAQANLLGEGEAQPEVQANIVSLQKQNAEALARIKALQDEETVHREGSAAASETDQKREKSQAEAEEAENKKQAQQDYVKQVEKKMQNADAATQIMQQIMELTTSSQEQIAALRKQLNKATSTEAANGVAEAEQAQQKAVDDARDEATQTQNKIRELVLCKTCPGKAQHLSELQDKLTAAKKNEEKQAQQQKSLEVASKASVQKAASAKVKLLEDEKKAAAEKLDDLETQVETKTAEESTMGLHAVKLDSSKNEAVASAMTHEEAKVAMTSKEKAEKKLLDAKTQLIRLVERRIKKEDKAAVAKAAAASKAKSDKIIGKIENKVRNLQGSYHTQKDSVEVEAKKLKSLALTAAAHGDVMNLVKAQGKTTKLIAGLQKTFKQLGAEKQALSEAQEWGMSQLVDAQASAKEKTADAMDAAKKLAEKETTPQLDQRISNAADEQKRADDDIIRTTANIKSTINTVAKVVASAAETASVAEGLSQEQMKEDAAKEQEAALKEKSSGVQSPQQAAKMAKKMESIKQTLAAADDAVEHARVKAEHVGQTVDAIAKQAIAPGNNPVDLAHQMIGEITSQIRFMTVMVSQAAERKLTNTMVAKLNMSMSSLKAQKEQLEEAIEVVNAAEVKKAEASRTEKKGKLALQFRRAIEKVDKMHEKALEQDKKVEKIRKNMLAVDHKMAAEISKHWQKTMEDKISGPSVQELQKQRTELNVKIKLAEQKKEEETSTVDKITEANAALDKTEAMMKKLQADMKDQQAKIDKLPTGSAEQTDALRQMDEMEKKELKVESEVDEDKAKAKDADSLTPQLTAADASITKFDSRLNELHKQKGQLAALLQTREIAMKTAGDDLQKQKRNADAVVKTKENIVKVSDDMKKYDNLKSIALTEKAAVDRTIKKAQDEMAREKQEKLDTKNKWVQDMVHYAQVEKAMKKVGGDESEKHLKRITQKNDQEEIGFKHEVAVKKEKQQKAEELKDKSEKRLKLSQKEKADKVKEKEEKQEMLGKEKTHKEGIKGELKNKKEEEASAKLDLKEEQKQKGAAAAQKEEREDKSFKQKAEAFTLTKENAEKSEKEFLDSKDAELAGRTKSEVTQKSAVKKIKDDVANAPAANEAAMKDGQASLIKEAEAAEVATKKKLEDDKNAARDKFSASKKDIVTDQESKDKAEVREAKAKAAEQYIHQEIEEKDRMEKDKKESTVKSVEAATKKEVEAKSDQEAAVKKHNKISKAFTAAAHQLKITEDACDSIQSRYDENQEKFEVFAKTRASTEQANAKKELANADQELRKDEVLYKNAETPEEELHFNDQVQLDRQILKVKREIAERDGNLVKTEKAEKLVAMDKLEQVTNAEKKAKLAADRANKDLEKSAKNENSFKVSANRLQKNKELREKEFQQASEAAELADSLVKTSTNEKSFKDKKATAATASKNKEERKIKMEEADSVADNQGKELEKSSKEGGVKEKAAKFAYDTARSAEVSASNEASAEAVQKMSARQNAASAHLLQVKSDAGKRVLYFQKFEEKAMKNIQASNTKKGFAKRMTEEKEEKNEVKDAKLMGERAQKGASDELSRKTDDKDLWKQLGEIKSKKEAKRQTAMELSNKAGETARDQIREDKKERDVEDKKNQANEKELKALAASGANKTDVAVQNPNEKEKPLPVEPDKRNPDLDEVLKKDHSVKPTDNPMVKTAGNFSSPYSAMAAEEKDTMRRRRSWHRRRRWVARRRSTAEKKTETQKLEQIQGKEEDKSITPKGFAGTFWAGVTGVQNLGDAITKVGTMAVTKKETIDSINYKSTPGYWIGLDSRFQNNFVARFRGYINVPANGTYTFFCIADDGANVYVNGEVVVKNDGMKKSEEQQEGKVELQTGLADVVVDYFCESGHCGLQVDWEGPGQEREPLSEKVIHQPKNQKEELGEMEAGDEDTREIGASSVVSLDDA